MSASGLEYLYHILDETGYLMDRAKDLTWIIRHKDTKALSYLKIKELVTGGSEHFFLNNPDGSGWIRYQY